MKLAQKLGLALFLTLNVWMIVISAIRTAYAQRPTQDGKVFDLVWIMFWIYVEAFVAIFIASFAAFRSLFVAHASRDSREAGAMTPSTFIKNRVLRRGQPNTMESLDSLRSSGPETGQELMDHPHSKAGVISVTNSDEQDTLMSVAPGSVIRHGANSWESGSNKVWQLPQTGKPVH